MSTLLDLLPYLLALLVMAVSGIVYFFFFRDIESKEIAAQLQKITTSKIFRIEEEDKIYKQKGFIENALKKYFKEAVEVRIPYTETFYRLLQRFPIYIILVCFTVGCAFTIVILRFFLDMGFIWATLLSFPIGFALCTSILSIIERRQSNKIIEDLPQALDIMWQSIRSGSTVEGAFHRVGKEIRGLIGKEFLFVSHQLELGAPFDDTLHAMSRRIDIPEFHFFTASLILQQRIGGSLSDTITNVGIALRQRKEMTMRISSLTAQGKISALVMGGIPFFVLLLMYFNNPNHVLYFFTDPTGRKLLGVALSLIGIGGLIIMKLLKIRT